MHYLKIFLLRAAPSLVEKQDGSKLPPKEPHCMIGKDEKKRVK